MSWIVNLKEKEKEPEAYEKILAVIGIKKLGSKSDCACWNPGLATARIFLTSGKLFSLTF